jgi:hypothetical protein
MATLLENGLPASRVMEAIKGPLVIRREEWRVSSDKCEGTK